MPASQRIVALFAAHNVHARPNSNTAVQLRIPITRPITGERTKMPLLARKRDSKGKLWFYVRTPGRTLGKPTPPKKGWITSDSTKRTQTVWGLVEDTSSRTLRVYRAGKEVKKYKTIVGAPTTQTPHGEFFVEESIHLPKNAAGEPYALALSARSNIFQEFEGGPGQIAIHGRNSIGGTLGTAVSHGCIRASTGAVTWLSKHIGQGVPVTIKR
ncbi:MAG: L,D-transpeptidase [Thermoleophilaceae bacterium]|nr:L,D-transpeptidase [Thermoleophilaceae bacterium]